MTFPSYSLDWMELLGRHLMIKKTESLPCVVDKNEEMRFNHTDIVRRAPSTVLDISDQGLTNLQTTSTYLFYEEGSRYVLSSFQYFVWIKNYGGWCSLVRTTLLKKKRNFGGTYRGSENKWETENKDEVKKLNICLDFPVISIFLPRSLSDFDNIQPPNIWI